MKILNEAGKPAQSSPLGAKPKPKSKVPAQKSTGTTGVASTPREVARSFADRWTPSIASSKNFTPVAGVFLDHYFALGIKHSEALFLIHLMSFKWGKKAPYPGIEALAAKMGVTPAAVRKYVRSLESKKLIVRMPRDEHFQRPFDLQPLFTAVEQAAGLTIAPQGKPEIEQLENEK